MVARRMLTLADRAEIATGVKAGWSVTAIASHVGRCKSVISREIRRNSTATGYWVVAADSRATQQRARPQVRAIDADPVLAARVRADLRVSRTPRQIAGRLRLEATDSTVEVMQRSPDAQGRTVSHEAIYRWIYAMPKGDLKKYGIMLQSKRTRRAPRTKVGERTARIVGMVSIDARPESATDRRVPGWWEGDLIIGAGNKSAAVTLVERATRYLRILALPLGKNADGVADALIENMSDLPDFMRRGLTWDQGTEMAGHASVTVAANLPIYFAHPHSPWERPTNENTNRLIREYLPKGTDITSSQTYLDAIASELNERPRATLNFYTPREKFEALLRDNVASTS
ncbi:integrase catalytic region [Gordonia polyisoprenivorans VH2]|uniref:Integrase catalytic region n=2 Tax=Gordonia polyisoprenivorans TaxID=84595 RepID=H6MTP8_GORPV|nr:integrase core domain-containing protein [Gordonia polyisoprenivorans VH2]AFA72523.1 putative transposase [Gordonia polyisoprenivorans VH2]AFA73923.1 integrase catalytic region [Gordonia polyisoprenivorans VH2]